MFVHTHTHRAAIPTQQRGQRPHVLLHQRVDLLLGEAPDAVAVHLPAHHAAVQVAQQPLQSVAQRAAHCQQLLCFLQVVNPLTVGYCPDRNTHTQQTSFYCWSEGRNGFTDEPNTHGLTGVETCKDTLYKVLPLQFAQ